MTSEVLQKIMQQERDFRSRDFIAPYAPGAKYAIVPMSHRGMYYKFQISGFTGSGFGKFHPTSPNAARFVEDAPFDETRMYLDALPRIQFILAYESEQGWIAFPFHADSARQKGVDGPTLIYNVSDAQRFDAVVARYDGANFWYDELFAGADPLKSEQMREKFEQGTKISIGLNIVGINGITPEDREAFSLACAGWKQYAKISIEQKIKDTLEAGGARLRSFVVRGENVDINWRSESGRIYHSLVKKDSLDVVLAGICLSGEDTKFHLKDLPDIIAECEKRNVIYITRRFNMDSSLDDD